MKVIVSMTTIPARNGTLGPVIDSLLAQSRAADEIWLYKTVGCEDNRHRQSGICQAYVADHGPVTKLWAAVDPSFGPDDLIVTVDDDIIYKPNWLAMVVAAAEVYPDDAIGFSGWNVGGFLAGTGSYQFASAPCFCDVLEGWAGAAYRKRFFDGIDILNPPPAFKFVDDVWISSVLNRRNIKRRLIAFPQAQVARENQSGLHTRLDFREMNRLAVLEGFS